MSVSTLSPSITANGSQLYAVVAFKVLLLDPAAKAE
jgi:hypothetical protein